MNYAVEISDLTFYYGSQEVLKRINVNIPSGQTIVIMGSSGCGKTTLLRLIAGFEQPLDGVVKIFGKEVSNSHLTVEPYKRQIGFVFQNLALWPHLTVEKHLKFALQEVKSKEDILHLARFFKLEKHLSKFPHQLSGGQKQLLALARAMAASPKILLMDEPLTGLDPALKKEILAYLWKIKNEFGTTVIYVTHESNEAKKLADYLIVMRSGEIVLKGSLDKVLSADDNYIKTLLE